MRFTGAGHQNEKSKGSLAKNERGAAKEVDGRRAVAAVEQREVVVGEKKTIKGEMVRKSRISRRAAKGLKIVGFQIRIPANESIPLWSPPRTSLKHRFYWQIRYFRYSRNKDRKA